MLKKILVVINVTSFVVFLYGIASNYIHMEKNACQMTYMFQAPQFKKIPVNKNKLFSNYGLYYYYEGDARIDLRNLNGAPVLFVPGNGGSYKQARSLASVALRMGMQMKNNVHLDYFTIDYGEELSAFYGGYLVKQKRFLQLCIRTLAKMYGKYTNDTVKIVIVGHSMGGVVAKSVMCEEDFVKHIETIIFLSTPLDKPVLDIDNIMHQFYEHSNQVLDENRSDQMRIHSSRGKSLWKNENSLSKKNLCNDVLLISIGGGVRDMQVPAWLTTSKFSNIHAMTSSIPNVWVSCCHLSIVWCLQLMKVINRFLHSITIRQANNYVTYGLDDEVKFIAAHNHFIGYPLTSTASRHIDLQMIINASSWHLEENLTFYKDFKNGLQKTYNQLMPLTLSKPKEIMYLEVSVVDNWLFGCVAQKTPEGTFVCTKIISLADHISILPAEENRKSFALLNTTAITKAHKEWTHILVSLSPTIETVSLCGDIHNSLQRQVRFQAPGLLDLFRDKLIVTKDDVSASYMRLVIENANYPYLAIQLNFKNVTCSKEKTDIIVKTSVSWAEGFDEYYSIKANEPNGDYIIANPQLENYHRVDNASGNLVYVDIYLNHPSCHFVISQQLSFSYTMWRIIQRFCTYLPAYVTAALTIAFSERFALIETSKNGLLTNVLTDVFQFKAMLISIAFYLLRLGLQSSATENSPQSILISIMLYGAAIILNILIALCVCTLLIFCGTLLKFIMPPFVKVLEFFPLAYVPGLFTGRLVVGVTIISITIATCCGIGLALACLVYFLWLSNAYKNLHFNQENSFKDVITLKSTTNDLISTDGNLSSANLLLHLNLLRFLLLLVAQNFGEILAWVIKYPSSRHIVHFEPQSLSTILLLISWILVWEIEDLCDVYDKSWILQFLLYAIAGVCIFYIEDNLYNLNYVVAFVFTSLMILGFCYKLKKTFVNTLKN